MPISATAEDERRVLSPEQDEAYRLWTALGLSDEQFYATLNQGRSEFEQNLAFQYWNAINSGKEAAARQRSAEAAGNAQAKAQAQADIERARIAADAAIQVANIDAASRERIVAQQLAVQLREIVATTTARPIDWTKQIAMLGGVPAAQAPTTGAMEFVQSPVPGVTGPYGAGPPMGGAAPSFGQMGATPQAAPVAGQGDQAWQQFRQGALGMAGRPVAIVGEAGPEVITQQGSNLQVSPLNRQGGIPRMQYGGTIGPETSSAAPNLPVSPWKRDRRDRARYLWARGGKGWRSPYAPGSPQNPIGGRRDMRGLERGRGWQGEEALPDFFRTRLGGFQGGLPSLQYGGTILNPTPAPAFDPNEPTPKERSDAGWYAANRKWLPVSEGEEYDAWNKVQAWQQARSQPPTPATPSSNLGAFGEQLFNPWPAFQASTLSRQMPGGGGYQTARPWEMPLNEFLNAPTQVQDARLAVWRQQGVIAGETPEDMYRSAMTMMRQAAFVGHERGAVTAYG